MDFTRRKKRGLDKRFHRLWLSPCGNYRITWVSQVGGVNVPPHYFAMVRYYPHPYGPDQGWTFVGKRGPYKKMKQAVEACEKNEKLWLHAISVAEGERKGRNDRLRALDMRARIGKGPQGNRVMATLPCWVRNKANAILMNLYFPRPGAVVEEDEPCSEPASTTHGPNDPTDLSLSTESKSSGPTPERKKRFKKTPTSGPASNAPEKDGCTPQEVSPAPSKATRCGKRSSARAAKEPSSDPKPSSPKPIAKPSKRSKKNSASGRKEKRSSEALGTS